MNTTQTYLALLVAVVIIGGGAYLYAQPKSEDAAMMKKDDAAMMDTKDKVMPQGSKDEAMMKDEVMMKKDDSMMKKDDAMMAVGSYESYSPEKVAAMAAKGKVVLFFRASWCPTCRGIDADIKAHLKDIPAGVTILDVNYDDSTVLKQKYGVTYQHTFVQVDASGMQLAKWSGSPTLAALLGQVK